MKKPFLLRHLSGEPCGRFPVWMMRQAGRYLPSYRAIRQDHSFWEMVTQPEIAARVSLLPLEVLPVDGVIFFSDILTPSYGMGIPVEMKESIGPVIPTPLRDEKAFSCFSSFHPAEHTAFVGQALKRIKEQMPEDLSLLGFAGAPWTVAAYLIEGRANREYACLKGWMHRDPASLARALTVLGEATASYLTYQIENGAEVVQLFDTWLSEMPRSFFLEHYLALLNGIFRRIKLNQGVPVIYFSKHAHHLIGDFGKLEADVLSIDELVPLTEAERRAGSHFHFQGNLDPALLLADSAVVRRQTRLLVAEARRLSRPAILNLGHGITPHAQMESVKAFVEEARALWI